MIGRLPTGWRDVTLVCGKCSKKIDGGFGSDGRTRLAKALRRTLDLGTGRKAAGGVVETKCLGVCPKRAVVVARAGGDWLVVPAGAEMGEVMRALGMDRAAANDRDAA